MINQPSIHWTIFNHDHVQSLSIFWIPFIFGADETRMNARDISDIAHSGMISLGNINAFSRSISVA